MDWLQLLLEPKTLLLILAIVVIVAIFSYAAVRAHHKHNERMARIKHDFNPD